VKASGSILIGGGTGDLQNHHPIGFDYGEVAAVDTEIKDPTSELLGGTGSNPNGLTINDLLWGGKVECSSCHDVHNTKNTGMKFVWVEDTQSNLCLSCHAK
jgi:predicted CXXCH cytochrome family protein